MHQTPDSSQGAQASLIATSADTGSLSSPHVRQALSSRQLMLWVMLACLPGLIAQSWFFGWGNLINVLLCMVTALVTEAVVLALRNRPLAFYLWDGSAAVTGLLLGLALPPLAPWWVALVATAFAIVIAKQLYGGLGFNPFNPAMIGYALVLVSFPLAMTTHWAIPTPLLEQGLSFADTLRQIFSGPIAGLDAYTGATPLDIYKHQIAASTAAELLQQPLFGPWIALGWEWVNGAFLLGGLILLARRIITWHIPVAVLASLSLMVLAFGWDPDLHLPLSLQIFSGATMLGAFFIATDPVTAPASHRGKLIYGGGIGILLYLIRTYGSYPDAVAFAVLLMNFAAPLIDHYTLPRAFGHAGRKA